MKKTTSEEVKTKELCVELRDQFYAMFSRTSFVYQRQDQGVTTLMDFIKDICPVPHEMPYEKTKDGKELKYDSKEAPSAFFCF